MKNWQERRNYRRIKDKKGNVIANIITVDGMDVEVTEDVFLAYSQADRKERYQDELQKEHPQVSLDFLTEHDVPSTYICSGTRFPLKTLPYSGKIMWNISCARNFLLPH